MKQSLLLRYALVNMIWVLALMACSSPVSVEEAAVKVDTIFPVQDAPGFAEFVFMEMNHSVKDYAKWLPIFNDDKVARKAAGLDDMRVGRNHDNQNNVLVALKVADIDKARAFVAEPRLKNIRDQAGVIAQPHTEYFRALRFRADANEKQWVHITHKVKDFDAWLKVFDAEGTESRAKQGFVDVLLARGIDQPNLVQMVFDVKDLDRAKASMQSAEKKKLMLEAGVEGMPEVAFFETVE